MTDSDHGAAARSGAPGPEAVTAGEDAPLELPDAQGATAEVEAALEQTRRSLEEREAQHLRLAADFENFRRRKAQELADRSRYASEDATRALLPVLDNLQRALAGAPAGTDDGFLEGVRMVVRQFDDALASLGVQPIASVGEPFDPALHEAIGGEESPDVERDTVIDELQRGYRLHDRVVRPALVRIAHPAGPATPAGDAAGGTGARG